MNEPDDSDISWKKKYSALTLEADHFGKEREESEKLLCRTIIRLTLAVNGLDPALDPFLKKLRKILKGGIDNEKLRKQVDAISEALLRPEEAHDEIADLAATDQINKEVLFDFLYFCTKDSKTERAIKKLESDFSNNKFQSLAELFAVIVQQLGDLESANSKKKTGFLGRIFSRQKKSDLAEGTIDASTSSELLTRLLDSLEVPIALQHKQQTIRKKSSDSGDLPLFFKTLEEIVQLLLSIKSRAREEQKEINGFLSGLQKQLKKLDGGAKNIKSIVNERSKAQNKMNLSFSGELEGLMTTANEATSLENLKQNLKSKLGSMSEQIEARLVQEEKRDIKVGTKFDEMDDHIKLLEIEASEMKNLLKLRNDQALNDALTGIPNRQAYDEKIANEFARWKRFNTSLMLLVWDIDLFKGINDRFGHQAGDVALQKIAMVLSTELRETDFVARYGGEEFVMLLSGASPEEALVKANMIRDKIRNCGFNSKGKPITITASCGLTGFSADDTPDKVFARGDKALYQAKANGRDQCVLV